MNGLSGTDEIQWFQADLQDLPVQKLECCQRLILGRGGDVAFRREVSQECADIKGIEITGMLATMENNEPPNPSDVGILGASAVVTGSGTSAHLVEQSRWL